MNVVNLIGVTAIIILTCAAIGTMGGTICDQTRHTHYAMHVTIAVTVTLTAISIAIVALWWQ